MDDEIPATPSVDEAIRALREYAQFEPQTRVMVWTPALATLVADALEAAARPAAGSSSPDVTALADELRNAILDIDAHATPFGTDDDGFVSGGYLISVGSLHRALGVVGHSAAKCGGCRNCWTLDQWKAEEQLLRDELEAQAARITELEAAIRVHRDRFLDGPYFQPDDGALWAVLQPRRPPFPPDPGTHPTEGDPP